MLKKISWFFCSIIYCIIKFYKFFLSPWFQPSCRFDPTCSEYFQDALKEYGFLKGTYKGVIRLLRCHPIKWLGGSFGYDPIISKRKRHGQ